MCNHPYCAGNQSRGSNVTLHIRARYKYGRVTYTGYQIATHYIITFVYMELKCHE